jgi:hypothetical protein
MEKLRFMVFEENICSKDRKINQRKKQIVNWRGGRVFASLHSSPNIVRVNK